MARSQTASRDDAALCDLAAPSASEPASRSSQPSGGFFRAVLIGLALSAPFWVGVVWLLSRIF